MVKRLFDILASSMGLLVLSPVLCVLAIVIYCKLGFPIFFMQTRPGLNGKLFTLIKFRTMSNVCSDDGGLSSDEERLTRFGKWLRASSLDELPELINVLLGEMSLVGPRPLLVQYLERYSPEQARRHEVRPGITGWAQINGRNAISWEQKFKYDVWYVCHHSLFLDLKIILLTIWKTIRRQDITHDNHATMEEFMGSRCRSSSGNLGQSINKEVK